MTTWDARQSTTSTNSWRSPYGRDRARIIHSAFFRRLQGKTQVLGLGESDFYRTRLTHSIEVAQISSGIVEYLVNNCSDIPSDIYPSDQLIEAIALAHDIGHPPFGHGGEVALNYVMRDSGGFEGNAQTLRIVAKLGESSPDNGLNLTRRTLLGLIKYPTYYSDTVCSAQYEVDKAPLQLHSYKPPKCIFSCEKETFDFVLEAFDSNDQCKFVEVISKGENKHKKSIYKGLDTSIMELADDIAYGVHDLEDAIALKLVSQKDWDAVVEKITDPTENYSLREKILEISNRLFSPKNTERKSAVSDLIGFFIESCKIKKQGLFNNDLLDYNAYLSDDARRTIDIFKDFVQQNVIHTPEVQTLEYKGQQMIVRIFEALAANPAQLLHKKYYEGYKKSGQDLRYICDYIAGTTDDYATRLYHKIFTPSSGSIFDRL